MSRLSSRTEPAGTRKHVRCAIYTRKSTEEGLDQAFNSLDAQREACAAYIASQRHEGWVDTGELYDDGGFTGGNMDRPGLKQLLAEVAAGKVDVIVVYKVDRLTRALSDFAKIVDVLDNAGASFVSITQSFNTTTSMGRLTLNVLLSFAQFEREVISERVRDKVAASKRKGMWMGGPVPLGYDVQDRKLVVNQREAATVRHIYDRYLALGSVRDLMHELTRQGVTGKARRSADGAAGRATSLSRGALYAMLSSRTYIGEVGYKDAVYPGQHDGIVDREVWDSVQARLAVNCVDRRHQTNARDPSVLAGMISNGEGRRMTPSHTRRGSTRYRYYVSVDDGGSSIAPIRIGAGEIESGVVAALVELVSDRARLFARLVDATTSGSDTNGLLIAANDLCRALPTMAPSQVRALLLAIDLHVTVHPDHVDAMIDLAKLGQRLGYRRSAGDDILLAETLLVPSVVVRRGKLMQLVIMPSSSTNSGRRDPKLIELLVRAHAARDRLGLGTKTNATQAVNHDAERAQLLRIARLSFLAPDIIAAILDGRQPPNLGVRQLTRIAGLPASWPEQRSMLGFAAR